MNALHIIIGLFVALGFPAIVLAWVERKGYFK